MRKRLWMLLAGFGTVVLVLGLGFVLRPAAADETGADRSLRAEASIDNCLQPGSSNGSRARIVACQATAEQEWRLEIAVLSDADSNGIGAAFAPGTFRALVWVVNESTGRCLAAIGSGTQVGTAVCGPNPRTVWAWDGSVTGVMIFKNAKAQADGRPANLASSGRFAALSELSAATAWHFGEDIPD